MPKHWDWTKGLPTGGELPVEQQEFKNLKELLGTDANKALFDQFFLDDPRTAIQSVAPFLGGQTLALLTNPGLVKGAIERAELENPGESSALGVLTDLPLLRQLTAGLSPFQRGERPEAFRGWHRRIIRR